MDRTVLRRAVDPDADAITRIHIESRVDARPYLPGLHTDEETLSYFRDVVLRRRDVRVAEHQNRVVGFIAFGPREIEHLYVLPDFQSKGIGRSLLQLAKDESAGTLDLYVFQRNVVARAFYAKHGFSCVEMTDGSRNDEREPDALYRWQR